MNCDRLLVQLDKLLITPDAVQRLRGFVLDLAVRGAFTSCQPSKDCSSGLLERIAAERARLIETGRLKARRAPAPVQPNEPPFPIPATWDWVRLGQIVDFSAGRTPSRNEPSYWNSGEYVWVSIGDMTDGAILNSTRETVTEKAAQDVFGVRPEPAGTILMSFKLTIGKMARLGIPAYHNEAIVAIKPYVSDTDPYLFSVLPVFARQGSTKGAIKGATLNRKTIYNIFIPLPSLEEQALIVTKVAELMALCDRLETSIRTAEDTRYRLLDSLLHEMVTPASRIAVGISTTTR